LVGVLRQILAVYAVKSCGDHRQVNFLFDVGVDDRTKDDVGFGVSCGTDDFGSFVDFKEA
jgi:hypothetical protein